MSKYTLFAFAAAFVVAGLVGVPAVFAAEPEKTDGTSFVCPVIQTDGVLNADNGNGVGAQPLGDTGYYTVAPNGAKDLSVPLNATNGDGDGAPGPSQSVPGDTDYTAIWSGQ